MKELTSNGSVVSIAQAIEEMKREQGNSFSLERINLAELERRCGISRGKLRRLKRNGFQDLPRATRGSKHKTTKLSGYTGMIDALLKQGIKNSSVILERLREAGFEGGATRNISLRISISFRPSGSRLRPREIVAAGIRPHPVRHSRWTGALLTSWTTTTAPFAWRALP